MRINIERLVRQSLASRGQNILLTFLDQGVSSLGNYAIAVVAARKLNGSELGAFAIAFLSYSISIGLIRSVLTKQTCYELPLCDASKSSKLVGDITSAALFIALCMALMLGFVAAIGLFGKQVGSALLALAFCLPVLALQDTWRVTLHYANRRGAALFNDATWTAFELLLLGILLVSQYSSAPVMVLAYGISSFGAFVLGVYQWRVRFNPIQGLRVLTKSRRSSSRYFWDFVLQSATANGLQFFLPAFIGLAAVGSLRSSQTLTGPLYMAVMASAYLAGPFARKRVGLRRPVLPPLLLVSVALSAVMLVGGLFWRLVPTNLVEILVGKHVYDALSLVLLIALAISGEVLGFGALTALRATNDAQQILKVRVLLAPITLSGPLIGVAIGELHGFLIGYAIAAWFTSTIWWSVAYLRLGKTFETPSCEN